MVHKYFGRSRFITSSPPFFLPFKCRLFKSVLSGRDGCSGSDTLCPVGTQKLLVSRCRRVKVTPTTWHTIQRDTWREWLKVELTKKIITWSPQSEAIIGRLDSEANPGSPTPGGPILEGLIQGGLTLGPNPDPQSTAQPRGPSLRTHSLWSPTPIHQARWTLDPLILIFYSKNKVK